MVLISNIDNESKVHITVLDQSTVCGSLPRLTQEASEFIHELNEKDIKTTEIGKTRPKIDILIGFDVLGASITEIYEILECGLVAIGWGVLGSRPTIKSVMHTFIYIF